MRAADTRQEKGEPGRVISDRHTPGEELDLPRLLPTDRAFVRASIANDNPAPSRGDAEP